MGWRLRLLYKTVRKFPEQPIYCQRQKCSQWNVVSGSIRFMQIFEEVPWVGGCQMRAWSLKMEIFTSVVHCLTEHFTHMITWQLSRDATCRLPWPHFKVIRLFHIKFLINGVWYGKSYYRLLIGNHTLAFDWCHFWWPWSTSEGHLSLGCHSMSISAILVLLSHRAVSQQ